MTEQLFEVFRWGSYALGAAAALVGFLLVGLTLCMTAEFVFKQYLDYVRGWEALYKFLRERARKK